MKILTKKKKDEILKVLTACQIIADHYIEDIEAYTCMTENLASVIFNIGGPKACMKANNTCRKYYKRGEDNAQTPGECADLQSGE